MSAPDQKPANKVTFVVLIGVVVMLLVVLFHPFKDFGDAIRPGFGDLIDGVIGLLVQAAVLVIAFVMRKRP